MKMVGVCAERLYWRMRRAVSSPSMSGMLTSSRITANSRARTSRSASDPERTMIRFCPSSSRMVLKTSSFSWRSSTTRMLHFSSCISGAAFALKGPPPFRLSMQPASQHREQMQAIDGLGQVVPGARLDALLAVALHRLRRHRDDRQGAAPRQLPDLLDGLDAVHLRHHDVHQHDVDLDVALDLLDRVAAVVRRDDLHSLLIEHRGEREDVAHVVVDDERALAFQYPVRRVQVLEELALGGRHARGAAVQEEVDVVEQPLARVRLAKREGAFAVLPAREHLSALVAEEHHRKQLRDRLAGEHVE